MVLITVGGPPGSGTTTVSRELRRRTGLDHIYAGELFRKKAEELGVSLSRFSGMCEKDRKWDLELDREMLKIARAGDAIIEGRMSGPLCKREDITSFRVYIDAELETRAKRVMERDGGSLEGVMRDMREREGSEAKRYLDYYGMDPRDRSHYHLVVDSTHMTVDEIANLIMNELERWKGSIEV